MQLSAFFPFYRNHNVLSAIPQEPYVGLQLLTVMRALSWEFPNDLSLASIDTQFLLGPSLIIVPALGLQMDTVKGIFSGVETGT